MGVGGAQTALIQEGICQFLAKECAQVVVNHLEDKACTGKVWFSKLTGSI